MKIKCTQHLLVVAMVAGTFSACGKKGDAPSPAQPDAATNATNQPAPAANLNASYEKLPGKWLRSDGDYILEIRSVALDGKMDAAYLNPRPINVSKAEASQASGNVKVFIELRDVNYPGSTYTLAYDPAVDQLKGFYFQAVERQQFEVFFERLK